MCGSVTHRRGILTHFPHTHLAACSPDESLPSPLPSDWVASQLEAPPALLLSRALMQAPQVPLPPGAAAKALPSLGDTPVAMAMLTSMRPEVRQGRGGKGGAVPVMLTSMRPEVRQGHRGKGGAVPVMLTSMRPEVTGEAGAWWVETRVTLGSNRVGRRGGGW